MIMKCEHCGNADLSKMYALERGATLEYEVLDSPGNEIRLHFKHAYASATSIFYLRCVVCGCDSTPDRGHVNANC